MNLSTLLQYADQALTSFPESKEEIIRITEDVFNLSRHEIALNKEMIVSSDQEKKFRDIVQKRKSGYPLAYILGYTFFYGEKFPVSEETLIPRYDTEHLVEAVRIYGKDCQNIIDICTGTGVIALSLHKLFPDKQILGIDIVEGPFDISKKYLGIQSDNISFLCVDFLNYSLWQNLDCYDCIISNPPYLDQHDMDVLDSHVKDFEPHRALYAGNDGLDFYKALRQFTDHHLKPGGLIVLETDHKHHAVSELFEDNYFESIALINDFNDLPRVLVLKKHP